MVVFRVRDGVRVLGVEKRRRGAEIVVEVVSDEWGSDRLDLDAYLARIGVHEELTPTGETLHRLHRAHATIPFENLDIVLGRTLSVELDDVQAKLVRAGRGGYCYEHGTLFAAVLDRLGYTVTRMMARVGANQQRPSPRSHLTLHVRSGDQEWLADVGFGGGLLEPLPWGDTGPHAQGNWSYQLSPDRERGWWLSERRGAEWVPLYGFVDDPQHAFDVRVANHFTSTHPSSPFVGKPVAMRKGDDYQLRLHGRMLTRLYADGSTEERELTDADVAAALREEFELRMSDHEIDGVLRSLPEPER